MSKINQPHLAAFKKLLLPIPYKIATGTVFLAFACSLLTIQSVNANLTSNVEVTTVETAVASSPTASADVITEHLVRSGETVSEIAVNYGLEPETILWANEINTSTPIKPGQELKILPFDGLIYSSKAGDTVQSVSDRFAISTQKIIDRNNLTATQLPDSRIDKKLQVGTELLIPRSFAYSYLLGRGGAELNDPADDEATNVEVETEKVNSNVPIEVVEAVDSLKEISEVIDEKETDNDDSDKGLRTGSNWVNPVPGSIVTQGAHGNGGVDFGAPVGTGIVASKGGTVVKAASGNNGGYGTMVEIDHGDGTSSLYAHLSTTLVRNGEFVSQGAPIGYVGMTGRTTGPHLHFEIHGTGNPFNSCGYLSSCGS